MGPIGGLDIGREQPVAVFRSKSLIIGKAPVAPTAAIEEKANAEDKHRGDDGSDRKSNELVRRRLGRR